MESDGLLKTISTFLQEIGIETEYRTLPVPTFLPGIDIQSGRIIIDPEGLKHPGDILHEAGHIAVTESHLRPLLSGNVEPDHPAASLEPAAILWSYAALRHLRLSPDVVFHPGGYKGQSSWLIKQFENQTYIGLPLLQWMGLALDETHAGILQVSPFPHMLKWMRD